MYKYFDPVVLRLIDILKKALPDAAEEDIFWGYHFVTGALMLTLARTGRIDKLSQGLCHSDDYAAVKARMARFMAAGFREICEQRKQDRGCRGTRAARYPRLPHAASFLPSPVSYNHFGRGQRCQANCRTGWG